MAQSGFYRRYILPLITLPSELRSLSRTWKEVWSPPGLEPDQPRSQSQQGDLYLGQPKQGSGGGVPLRGRRFGVTKGGRKWHIAQELIYGEAKSLCDRDLDAIVMLRPHQIERDKHQICKRCLKLSSQGEI